MKYDIVFYVTGRGEVPVIEFMRSLSDKEIIKSLAYMRLLQKEGNTLPSNYVKHIGDGLYELRPEWGGVELRYFYFTVFNDTIVMLHAIKKKSQKTPARDLEIARSRMIESKPK